MSSPIGFMGARSRSATPSIPPGFGLAPAPAILKQQHPPTGLSKPPVTPQVAAHAIAPVQQQASGTRVSSKKSGAEAKKSGKALAAEAGLAKETASLSKAAKGKQAVLHDEDFPALDSVKPVPVAQAATPAVPIIPKAGAARAAAAPVTKKGLAEQQHQQQPAASNPAPSAAPSKSDKRPVPGTLNIAAATKAMEKSAADQASSFPALPTPSSTSSPMTRAGPKTLRVVPTPKTEAPPPISAAAAIAAQLQSGRSSVLSSHRPGTPASELISDSASIFSGSLSTSRPASRPGSPPPAAAPSRIGSAAVRSTTKSQQRKQRKQATKLEAAAISSAPVVEPEAPVIAPILGRKKKQQKKEKPSSAATPVENRSRSNTAASPAASTQPAATPSPVEEPKVSSSKDKPVSAMAVGEQPRDSAAAPPVKEKAEKPQKSDSKGKKKEKEKAKDKDKQKDKANAGAPPATAAPAQEPAAVESPSADLVADGADSKEPSAASTLEDLKARALVDDLAMRRLLEPVVGLNHTFEPPEGFAFTSASTGNGKSKEPAAAAVASSSRDAAVAAASSTAEAMAAVVLAGGASPSKSIVTDEDHAALQEGKVVRKVVDGVRVMLTPNGDCERHLADEEEARFLELQASLARWVGTPAFYTHPRHEASSGGFCLVKGRAVPNGPPSFFPSTPHPDGVGGGVGAAATASDPVGKIQREEAIYYINQYVLPRINLGPSSASVPGGDPLLSHGGSGRTGSGRPGSGGSGGGGGGHHINQGMATSLDTFAGWIDGPDYGAGAYDDAPHSWSGGIDLVASSAGEPGEFHHHHHRLELVSPLDDHDGLLSYSPPPLPHAGEYLDDGHGGHPLATGAAALAGLHHLHSLPADHTPTYGPSSGTTMTTTMTTTTAAAAANNNNNSSSNEQRQQQQQQPIGATPTTGSSGATATLGTVPLMSVEDAEKALAVARRETEKIEKQLNAVIRRNRRLLLSSSGGN